MKCATYACNRRTRRWSLDIFYIILNVCSVNSFIIFLCYTESPVTTRFSFIKELSKELIEPHLRRRLAIPNIPRDIKEVITMALGDGKNERPREVPDDRFQKRKNCSKCPYIKQRKTAYGCIKCSRPICLECSRKVCTDCALLCINIVLM